MHFQELFTESEKLAVLSLSVIVKLGRTPKSCKILYIFGLSFISIVKLGKPYLFGSNNKVQTTIELLLLTEPSRLNTDVGVLKKTGK